MTEENKPRYKELYEKAEKLEEKARRMRHLAGNLFGIHNVSDNERRAILNNENHGLNVQYYGACIFGTSFKLEPKQIDHIMYVFSEAGDPLCSAMNQFPGLPDSSVLLKILRRTMTEEEYNGILNSDLPFANLDEFSSNPIYLSKYLSKSESVESR